MGSALRYNRCVRALSVLASMCVCCQPRAPENAFSCTNDRQCPDALLCNVETRRCVYNIESSSAASSPNNDPSAQMAGAAGSSKPAAADGVSAGQPVSPAAAGSSSPADPSAAATLAGAGRPATAGTGALTNVSAGAGASMQGSCSPGEKRCEASLLRSCEADGQTWSMQTCDQGCNGPLKACNMCNPERELPTCRNSQLSVCRSNGTGHDVTHCDNGCRADESGCKDCIASEHTCNGICVSNNDPQHCGDSCSPCPSVAHAQLGCPAGICKATCDTDRVECQGTASMQVCAPRRWDFESGAERWMGFTGSDTASSDTVLMVSTERAHAGTSALRLPLTVTATRYRVSIATMLCDDNRKSGIDLLNKTLQAWVYIAAPDNTPVNSCLLFGRDLPGNNIGAGNDTTVPINQWFMLRSSALSEATASKAATVNIDCTVRLSGTNQDQSWNGTLYIDDITLP